MGVFVILVVVVVLSAVAVFFALQNKKVREFVEQNKYYQEAKKKLQEMKTKEHPKTDQVTAPKETVQETKPTEKKMEESPKVEEGTHVPKPKGEKPVIEDAGNGKKRVVSGDKSILLDEIRSKYTAELDAKYKECEEAKQEWLKAKEANDPSRNEKAEKHKVLKEELEQLKRTTAKRVFDEVQVYIPEEDTIDLHCQTLEGAIWMLEEQIAQQQAAGRSILRVSCGMGHHNTVGFSKVKETVVAKLKEKGLKFEVDETTGFVTISF